MSKVLKIRGKQIGYGRLYRWEVTQKTLINGFTVPTGDEWTALEDYIDTEYNQDPDDFGVGNHLKSRRQVNSPLGAPWATEEHPRWNQSSDAHGRDSVGLSLLPGERRNESGTFTGVDDLQGGAAFIWTSSASAESGYLSNFGQLRRITNSGSGINTEGNRKESGVSIRCIRPATVEEEALDDGDSCGIVTDYDGNRYNTIKIDDKVWTQQNFEGTHYANGDPIPHVPDAGDWGNLTETSEAYCNYDNDENNVFVIKKKVLKVAGKVLKI